MIKTHEHTLDTSKPLDNIKTKTMKLYRKDPQPLRYVIKQGIVLKNIEKPTLGINRVEKKEKKKKKKKNEDSQIMGRKVNKEKCSMRENNQENST